LGWLLLALLLLPLILVFTVPVVMVGIVGFEGLGLKRRCCKNPCIFLYGSLVSLILFSIGMALNVIAIPLFLVIGLPIIIGTMIY